MNRKDEMPDDRFIEDKNEVAGTRLNDHAHKALTRKVLLKLDFRYDSLHGAPIHPDDID